MLERSDPESWGRPKPTRRSDVAGTGARRPTFGSVISRLRGGHDPLLPSYVSLDEYVANHAELEHPQYVGGAYRPFLYGGESMRSLGLKHDFTPQRLVGRKQLIRTFDELKRHADPAHLSGAMDSFRTQALEIITSEKARRAFDLTQEPDRVRRKHGGRDAK